MSSSSSSSSSPRPSLPHIPASRRQAPSPSHSPAPNFTSTSASNSTSAFKSSPFSRKPAPGSKEGPSPSKSNIPPRISIPPGVTHDNKLRTEYLQVPSQSYLRQAHQARSGGYLESVTSQQALFQAYLHAIRSGRIPMPSISHVVSKAQQQANHNQTIADVKRGVTYAGQDQLKKLPIPPLEDTCKRYLESVKPFLVLKFKGSS